MSTSRQEITLLQSKLEETMEGVQTCKCCVSLFIESNGVDACTQTGNTKGRSGT